MLRFSCFDVGTENEELNVTMGHDRLYYHAVLSIEREELCKLSHSKVIDRFAKIKERWYSLMLINSLRT